jgi:ABC-type multidrug transport system fused ATPase/permease subunit
VRDQVQEYLRGQLQARVMAKAQALPLAAFEQATLYDQLQRVERGLETRIAATVTWIFWAGNDVVTLTGLVLYLGAAHASLPVVLTVGTGAFVLLHVRRLHAQHMLERRQTERQRRLGYLEALMSEREAAAEIRLFGLRGHLLESWKRLFVELREERLSLARRTFGIEGAHTIGRSLTFGLALAVVVSLIAGGDLTLGQYAAFVAAVHTFQANLRDLFWGIAVVDNDLRYVQEFFLYLDLPEERQRLVLGARCSAKTGGTSRATLQANDSQPSTKHQAPSAATHAPVIRFDHVCFTYPGADRPALQGINLRLSPGERIALVGENGAGKTTLAKLLLGLYRPSEGRVLVDGEDLAEMDPEEWRRRAAAVFQDFQQYHLTLRENIAFGNLERSDDLTAIERAAHLAGADALLATLPDGYETQLGKEYEKGIELSLGQWQKLAIARAYLAYLREAEVLVLDEPTAALDPKAEVEVYRQFRDVSMGKSVLLISHRLGSARLADRIVVLEEGRIVEEGSHEELIRAGGRYARMLQTQAQWYR